MTVAVTGHVTGAEPHLAEIDRLVTSRTLHGSESLCKLLRYLAERRDRVVHREELLREVWEIVDGSTTRAVDFAVARLRQKIEPNPPEPRFLRTVHGDGYSLTVDRDSR